MAAAAGYASGHSPAFRRRQKNPRTSNPFYCARIRPRPFRPSVPAARLRFPWRSPSVNLKRRPPHVRRKNNPRSPGQGKSLPPLALFRRTLSPVLLFPVKRCLTFCLTLPTAPPATLKQTVAILSGGRAFTAINAARFVRASSIFRRSIKAPPTPEGGEPPQASPRAKKFYGTRGPRPRRKNKRQRTRPKTEDKEFFFALPFYRGLHFIKSPLTL